MAKVMISLPDDLLEALDGEAARREQSRSALIREALRERLARSSIDQRREALEVLRRNFLDGAWNAEELVRAERDR